MTLISSKFGVEWNKKVVYIANTAKRNDITAISERTRKKGNTDHSNASSETCNIGMQSANTNRDCAMTWLTPKAKFTLMRLGWRDLEGRHIINPWQYLVIDFYSIFLALYKSSRDLDPRSSTPSHGGIWNGNLTRLICIARCLPFFQWHIMPQPFPGVNLNNQANDSSQNSNTTTRNITDC